MDFLQQWESSGTPMQSTLLAFERRPAGDAVGASLGVDAEAAVLFIKRVRAAARVPIAIDYRYIPNDLVADWDETSARGSPLHLLWQKMDLSNGDFAIEAATAGPEEIEYLHLSAGAPVLIRTLRYCDGEGPSGDGGPYGPSRRSRSLLIERAAVAPTACVPRAAPSAMVLHDD